MHQHVQTTLLLLLLPLSLLLLVLRSVRGFSTCLPIPKVDLQLVAKCQCGASNADLVLLFLRLLLPLCVLLPVLCPLLLLRWPLHLL